MDPLFVPITASSRGIDRALTAAGDACQPISAASTLLSWRPRHRRRILCVFPKYAHSFGTFDHAFPLVGVKAFMPPQGLLVVAGTLPREWKVRFVDENIAPATDEDFAWADAVLISGMHVQRARILEINQRAHAAGKLTVLGGPSASACPEWYPDVDLLHIGELGDATAALLRRLDESIARPPAGVQERFETRQRLDLAEFPAPAYRLIRLRDYLMGSVQFSSGCPYRCEFCDIPELYGRKPRLKPPLRVTRELDAMLARGNPGTVYFVDDNFIANPAAAANLVRELVLWQRERGYPLRFACEATLNLAKHDSLMRMMREAGFTTVFCGIETPEEIALRAIGKSHNIREPILEAVARLNRHGLEVVSGIIMGLDTDTERTGEAIREFIAQSQIPLLTVNLLHALPRTPLWRRLAAAGRLKSEAAPDADAGDVSSSNVVFLLPEETVVRSWRETIAWAYTPQAVYARFDHQMRHTYPNRKPLPRSRSRGGVLRGAGILARIIWRVGVLSRYRLVFWRRAVPWLMRGKVEELIHVAVVSHHLIQFARECSRGRGEHSFYSPRSPRPAADPAARLDAAREALAEPR